MSGEAQADDQSTKTISGDSGSVVDEAVAETEKKLTKKEKRALRKKARKQKAALARAERKKKQSNLICTREKLTGSNFRQKVCRTQEEIKARREADQRAIRQINKTGAGTPQN